MIDSEKYQFRIPGDWDTGCYFRDKDHEWHVFHHHDISTNDKFKAVAIAICKDCAKISGGWIGEY